MAAFEKHNQHWKEVTRSFSFASLSEFNEFLTVAQSCVSKIKRTYNLQYNALKVYDLYKTGKVSDEKDLDKRIHQESQTFTKLAMDHTCISHSYQLRADLLDAYPSLKRDRSEFLYMSTSMFWPHDVTDFESIKDIPANFHASHFCGHCALVLKFQVDDRPGYLIFESFESFFFPVVVMEDHSVPSSGELTTPFGHTAKYKYLGNGLVANLYRTKTSTKCFFTFVSHDYVGIDQLMIYCGIFPFLYNLVFLHFVGHVGRILKFNTERKTLDIMWLNEKNGTKNVTTVSISYFLEKEMSQEVENLILETCDFAKQDYAAFRKQLSATASAIDDLKFLDLNKKVMDGFLVSLL